MASTRAFCIGCFRATAKPSLHRHVLQPRAKAVIFRQRNIYPARYQFQDYLGLYASTKFFRQAFSVRDHEGEGGVKDKAFLLPKNMFIQRWQFAVPWSGNQWQEK
ncbi:hypothetical protein HPP92_023655 [Vanilla planifolia]|uniref:Uncharacterized protein n=1 Tax=Vanilla planifolia TaxID=51239 RepID=A0A835PQQ1_VANPL|nr:hypothetical protein HPP92_023655 [Vanilla planifolia]